MPKLEPTQSSARPEGRWWHWPNYVPPQEELELWRKGINPGPTADYKRANFFEKGK